MIFYKLEVSLMIHSEIVSTDIEPLFLFDLQEMSL